MPDTRPRPGEKSPCLDPETVAALVDGRLSGDELAAAKAHLEACDDCAEFAAELTIAVDAAPAAPSAIPARVGPGPNRRWTWIGPALAAAAVIVLVVRLQPGWFFGGANGDPRLAALVAAAGTERSVEGRLTGGFPYGALRTPDRSGGRGENYRLMAAAGELQQAADRDPTPDNLHAWGIAQLALGDLDAGLDTLEAAALQGGMTARLAADLGAARLAVATSSDRQDLLPRALETLEEATTLDPGLVEAWFTKAIVREQLRLPAQAAEAWRRYLELDPSSAWSDEARRRLEALEKQSAAKRGSRQGNG
jgi:tetratricopeptide (TPR) repeat protein